MRPYGQKRRPSRRGAKAALEPTRSFAWPVPCRSHPYLQATTGFDRCGPCLGSSRVDHRTAARRVAALLMPHVPDVLEWFLLRGDPEEKLVAWEALQRLTDAAAAASAPPLSPEEGFPFPVDADLVAEENFGSDSGDRRAQRVHLKRALLAVELACDRP